MKAIATLTICNAAGMTLTGREAMAEWLVLKASDLVLKGKQYPRRFCRRYIHQRTKNHEHTEK